MGCADLDERDASVRGRARRAGEPGHHAGGAELLGVQAAGAGAPSAMWATRDSPTRSIASSRRRAVRIRLKPAPRADRHTLVRRAYLDLLGLPPTPAQVDAFVADRSPDAWERLIDGLLASPHYGERYGRLWLDIARYADSAGFEYDTHRPNAWRYRDYVIKSFNDDKPYDRFLIEQLAGDEMDGRTNDSLVATGFLRMGPRVLFREKDNPERRYDYLDEIIGTIGKGTLGLTVNCARCHNHKFDPISQKDYYRFEASLFGYVETEVPLAPKAEADAYLAKNAGDRREDRRAQGRRSNTSSIRIAIGCSSNRSRPSFPTMSSGFWPSPKASGRPARRCSPPRC